MFPQKSLRFVTLRGNEQVLQGKCQRPRNAVCLATNRGGERVHARHEVLLREDEPRQEAFCPPRQCPSRPVVDLPEAIRAASKVAVNPFVARPESLRDVLNEFFEEKLRRREWEATTKGGHRHIYEAFVTSVTKPLDAVTTRDLQEWYDEQRARAQREKNSAQSRCRCRDRKA